MATQAGTFNVQEFTDAGLPLVGGRLYTYSYGTTTQKTAYTDAAGLIPHTYTTDGAGGQYIALNSRGELPAPLYLVTDSYDLALKRSDGSTVWTRRADGPDALSTISTSLTGVAGTNTITGSLTGLSSYTAGQSFLFVAASANTGAVTLNINSIGAKSITRDGATALITGDILAGQEVVVAYDGTQFQLVTKPTQGRLLNIQYFTATAVYTPTVGTRFVVVEVQAAGGGSGGCAATGAGQVSAGAGGGGGGWGRKTISSGFSGVTVTVGAAGAGGAIAGNGGAGVSSSFGAALVCAGGLGGTGVAASATLTGILAAAVAGGGVTGADISQPGSASDIVFSLSATSVIGGSGGSSHYGGRIPQAGSGSATAAVSGTGYGAGGGAPVNIQSTGGQTGAGGAPGIVIVHEYA